MSPEQHERANLLKTRNARRLQRDAMEKELAAAGLNGAPVGDERAERLLNELKLASPVQHLEANKEWQAAVSAFADGRFGLTIAQLWDWDGTVPMYRVAAASLRQRPDCLARLYPSGFWLVDDDDCHVLVVDFDFDEDTRLTAASLRELELPNVKNR